MFLKHDDTRFYDKQKAFLPAQISLNGVGEVVLWFLFFRKTYSTGVFIIVSCDIFSIFFTKVRAFVVTVVVAIATCIDRLEIAFLGEFFEL